MSRILITTDYLQPGDAVDTYLTDLGHETIHAPLKGRRELSDLTALLHGVDGALVANEPLTAEVLAAAPTLKAIVRTGVGYDSVDVEAATDHGILVSNLPGINANAVAEYTMALMLAASRRLVELAAGVADGRWPRTDGHELRGSTLGLIGYGASARGVVPLARAFGMRVLVHTKMSVLEQPGASEVEVVDLNTLLAESDVVSIHTALTPVTRHLIDARALELMKTQTILVNTARGPIVDEDALVAAVRSGSIAGAALDVCEVEPLPAESPLRGVVGITVYSHMAGQTVEARDAAGREGAAELVRALNGQPSYRVNRADHDSFRVQLRG